MRPRSLFSLAKHLEWLSKDGDPLEVLAATVEFEHFRPLLTKGLGYGDGAKGRRPAFDPVAMFKVLVVQAQQRAVFDRFESRGGFLLGMVSDAESVLVKEASMGGSTSLDGFALPPSGCG